MVAKPVAMSAKSVSEPGIDEGFAEKVPIYVQEPSKYGKSLK